MAINEIIICDCCGKECERWYDLTLTPNAKKSWINVFDMLPENGYSSSPIWHKQICKGCFERFLNNRSASHEQ